MERKPSARKYDAGDRREKQEEMRRLAELKRRREAAGAGPSLPPSVPTPEIRPGPKDARFEGRAAKDEEQRALKARRDHDLLYGVRMKAAEHSRWKQQAEAQGRTVESRLRDLFGAKPAEKDGRAKRRK